MDFGLGPRLAQGLERDVFHVGRRAVVKWHFDSEVPRVSDRHGPIALLLGAFALAWAMCGHRALGLAPRADLVLGMATGPVLPEVWP